eukprot:COSAG05_NODE_1064_length_5991_cov_12.180414_13_plen_81_part_00
MREASRSSSTQLCCWFLLVSAGFQLALERAKAEAMIDERTRGAALVRSSLGRPQSDDPLLANANRLLAAVGPELDKMQRR